MAMLLSEEQRMLADSAGSFLADRRSVGGLRAIRDGNNPDGFDRPLWSACAAMGFAGILVEPAFGGLGLGHVEAGLVQEAMGRHLTLSPFLSTAVGAATALRHAAPELQQHWLPRIVAGDAVVAIALDEGARHRPERIALTAAAAGDGFRLSGTKRPVIHGDAADALLVLARTAGAGDQPEGTTWFLTERETPGLSLRRERLLDAGMAAEVRFDEVRVQQANLVGAIGQGQAVTAEMLAALRTGAAAELVGLGLAAFAMTVAYLKERRQFGRPIGSFQALQHRAAHLHGELQLAAAAVLKAQQLLGAGDAGAGAAACVAKAVASDASALAVQEGVQMHGGMGMTDEHDIGLFMKRQRVLAELWGDSDYHADKLARDQGY